MPGCCQVPAPGDLAFPMGIPVRWRSQEGTGLSARGFAGAHQLLHGHRGPGRGARGSLSPGLHPEALSMHGTAFARDKGFACKCVCPSVRHPPELAAHPRILATPLANTWDATKARLDQLGSREGFDITK